MTRWLVVCTRCDPMIVLGLLAYEPDAADVQDVGGLHDTAMHPGETEHAVKVVKSAFYGLPPEPS